MNKAKTLLKMYRKMLDTLGPQQWWPGETSFEVIIGAILTQNTNWSNVEKAIKNLKTAGKLSPAGIHELAMSELAQLIRPSGFFNVKAKRVKAFIHWLFSRYEGNLSRMFAQDLETYAVDPSTGTVGNSLVSNTYYDANGQTLESYPAGSEAFSKMTYDGVGRQIAQYVGYAESSAGSSSSSGGAAGDVIFEQRETLYDAASNVIFSTSRQRFHDATGTGPLQGPSGSQPKSRDSYGAMWYDGVGRSVASANYGTNDNAGPPERPEVPPESTELILVSQTGYNERGEAFETIDPSGMVGRSYADDAGRTVRTIQNYVAGEGCFCPGSEQNVTTEMRYGPGSQLWQLIAKNPATGDQVTRYDYGVTLSNSDLASNDLLRAEIYCWKWCHCNDFVEVCPLARLNLRCTPAQKR